MLLWRDKPKGGGEHTKLWKIFLSKADRIEELPQGEVSSETRIFPKLDLDLKPDGIVYEGGEIPEIGIIIYGGAFCFEFETDWKQAICKVAKYSLANKDNKLIIQLFFVVKKENKSIDSRKLREWLNELEKIGQFRIRWFFISLEDEKMYELRENGSWKLI